MSDKKRDTVWVNMNWKLRSSSHWIGADDDVPMKMIEETWMMPLRMLQYAVRLELTNE